MKKTICFLIIILSLFLVSCGGTTPTSTQSATSAVEVTEPTIVPVANSRYHGVVEATSRILLISGSTLWYYSKADGESYHFCFDPLCQHSLKNGFCVSRLFPHLDYTYERCVYSEKYNRFFFARGQNIYSTSFDASDLKLEYSFGEEGKIDRSLTAGEMNQYDNYISNLKIYGDYLYFRRANDDFGVWQIIRYDIRTQKIAEMTPDTGEWITSYAIVDDYIYFKTLGDGWKIRFFTTDLDFNERHEVDDSISIAASNSSVEVYYGGYFYERNVNIVDGVATDGELYRINPLTGEKTLIAKDDRLGSGSSQILCADKNGVYFSAWEYAATGIVEDDIQGRHEVGTTHNNIWRISFDGEFTKVLDFPRGEIETMNFVSGGVIVFFKGIYHKEINVESPEAAGMVYVLFEIDENGNFVNPKVIGKDAENADLVKLFEGDWQSVAPSTPTETTAATTAVTASASESTTATTAATATTATTATSTTGEPIIVDPFVSAGYQRYSNLSLQKDVKTPGGVVLTSVDDKTTQNTWYYDKESGEMKIFCSDPDCEHVFFTDTFAWTYTLDCPAAMMGKIYHFFTDFSYAPVYVNGRVYFAILSGMYSCKENGGDVREEFKFSENTDYIKERQKYIDDKFPFIRIFSDGRSVFFYHYEDKKGFLQYRYDTWTRELYDMTDDLEKAAATLGYTVYVDSAADGKIYLSAYSGVTAPPTITMKSFESTGTLVGYYETDYDFSSFEEADDYIASPDFVAHDGVIGKLGNDYVKRKYSGEKVVLIENVDDVLGDTFNALYLSGKYLYYVKEENLVIGKKENYYGFKRDAVSLNGGKIYRYDLETGDIACVFDDYHYDRFRAVYIDEESGAFLFYAIRFVEVEDAFYDKYLIKAITECKINGDGTLNIQKEYFPIEENILRYTP
ncbi:MAG: hypothetical protein J5832_05655 [Clostridia bacterium]|nr:hypothetical protein [Clostridia bacterium]